MDKVVFVTAVGGDIGSTVLKCIRRGYACRKLIGCDIQPYVQGIDFVDEFFLAPTYRRKEEYLAFVHRICEEQKVTHFFPIGEPEILIAEEDKDYFAGRGIHLVANHSGILEVASSKYRTARYLQSNGIPTPATWYKAQYGGQLDYPFIVKADRGCGSKELWLVHNEKEWEALAGLAGGDYVVQEYIGDAEHEYTTGVFSDAKTVRSITYRRTLGYGGMSIRVETVAEEEVERLAEQTARLLKLEGSVNIQMRKGKDGFRIFEINPRISSTAGFRDKMGFHDVVWWLRHMDGEAVEYGKKAEPGIVGIRTLDEKVFPAGG